MSDNLIDFFRSYLSDRCQVVKVNKVYSEPFLSTSGVSQGSSLGPLMFVLYINDIKPIFKHSLFLLYPEDLKCYKIINKSTFKKDCRRLQGDLKRLATWCQKNYLTVNINKSYVVSYSKGSIELFNYNMDGSDLTRVTRVRDLGVLFNSNYSFNDHISKTVTKALKTLGFVMRCASVFRNLGFLRTLYFILVRSILEYACIIWSPFMIL